MKAAILQTINAPLVVGDVVPHALTSGQVLVKMIVSGICGTQLHEIAGNRNNAQFVPHLLGHEGCGIVEHVGMDVTKVKQGDKVVVHWRKGEGIEADFPIYTYNGKEMRSGKSTTLGEYSIVSENRITPVPHDVPNDFCALLGCGLSTALGAVQNDAQVRPDESVMVIGLGGLGACLIKAARSAGAKPVIGVDMFDNKKEILTALHGDAFINSAKENIGEVIGQSLGVRGVDVIFDATGNAKSIAETIPLLNEGGRYVLVGFLKPGESFEVKNANHLFGNTRGKAIIAAQGGGFSPSKDIPRYVELWKSGALDINHLITHRVTLDTINDGIELMRQGKANRVMVDIQTS